MDLFLLRHYDPHALEFVVGYAAVAAAAGFADARHFRDHVVNRAHSWTNIGHDILSVHCPYGHFYVRDGEITTHPSSAEVLGDQRRGSVTLKRKQETEGWRRDGSCTVSSGSVVL